MLGVIVTVTGHYTQQNREEHPLRPVAEKTWDHCNLHGTSLRLTGCNLC